MGIGVSINVILKRGEGHTAGYGLRSRLKNIIISPAGMGNAKDSHNIISLVDVV